MTGQRLAAAGGRGQHAGEAGGQTRDGLVSAPHRETIERISSSAAFARATGPSLSSRSAAARRARCRPGPARPSWRRGAARPLPPPPAAARPGTQPRAPRSRSSASACSRSPSTSRRSLIRAWSSARRPRSPPTAAERLERTVDVDLLALALAQRGQPAVQRAGRSPICCCELRRPRPAAPSPPPRPSPPPARARPARQALVQGACRLVILLLRVRQLLLGGTDFAVDLLQLGQLALQLRALVGQRLVLLGEVVDLRLQLAFALGRFRLEAGLALGALRLLLCRLGLGRLERAAGIEVAPPADDRQQHGQHEAADHEPVLARPRLRRRWRSSQRLPASLDLPTRGARCTSMGAPAATEILRVVAYSGAKERRGPAGNAATEWARPDRARVDPERSYQCVALRDVRAGRPVGVPSRARAGRTSADQRRRRALPASSCGGSRAVARRLPRLRPGVPLPDRALAACARIPTCWRSSPRT